MAKILLYGDCKELGYTPPESVCDIVYNIQLIWTDDTVNKVSENIDNDLRSSRPRPRAWTGSSQASAPSGATPVAPCAWL